MIDIVTSYQASIFVNTDEFLPNNSTISKMLELLGDKNFIPNVMNEIKNGSIPMPRLRMSTLNGEWNVNFLTGRIDIFKNETDSTGSNMGSINNFSNEVSEIFSRILKSYNKKTSRVSFVAKCFLKELSVASMSTICGTIIQPKGRFNSSNTNDWDVRIGIVDELNILEKKEKINIVASIGRKKGSFIKETGLENFDRIEIVLDINTLHENSNNRFGELETKCFYSSMEELFNNIILELGLDYE